RALAQSRFTLLAVSSPESVVRSISVIAFSNQAACHCFFTVRRVGIVAARRSAALLLTRMARTTSRSSGPPGFRGRSEALTWSAASCRGQHRLSSRMQARHQARERDALADVRRAADPRNGALEAESEARVHERAVLAQVEIPAVRVERQVLFLDAVQQLVVVVL